MRILYLHQYFCTPRGAGGVRSYEFARRWVAAGHEVEVVTGTGYDRTLEPNTVTLVDGIRVRTLGAAYAANMGFVRRLWSFFQFAIKSSWYASRAKDYDVVLATSTPLTIAIPALCAKWIARRPLVFEVRDVWPDAAVDIGQLKNPLLIAMARWLEATVYRAADQIVPLSDGMEDRIAEKGVSRAKMTMIPNCSDLERFARGKRARFREQYGCTDKFVILYVGAISAANHIEALADVIDRLQAHEDWEWWFAGNGSRYEWLKQAAVDRGWKHVRLMGPVPREDVGDLAAAADCGVVSFVPQPVYYENSPNKFFDYIAAGLPMVFSRSTWLEKYIAEYHCGFVGRDGNPDHMVEHLLRLKADPELRTAMGRNARRMAEESFSRDVMSDKYLTLFEKIVGGADRAGPEHVIPTTQSQST
jgi:glycosyltransferase involved in cell wall biosynthesis